MKIDVKFNSNNHSMNPEFSNSIPAGDGGTNVTINGEVQKTFAVDEYTDEKISVIQKRITEECLPQMSALGDENAEQILGKDLHYNRLYCERSWMDVDDDGEIDKRGAYARICLTEQPKPPPNPTSYIEDPTPYNNGEYGEGVTLNSVPQRTKHGDLRVPKRTFDEAKALDEYNYLDYAASLYILKKGLESKLDLMPDHSLISMPYVYVENSDRTVNGYPLAHGPISSSARVVQSLSDGSIRCKVPAKAQDDYVVNKGFVETVLGSKLDKSTYNESLYGVKNGNQTMFAYSTKNTPWSIAMRAESGAIVVSDATADNEAVPLQQLNEILNTRLGSLDTALDEILALQEFYTGATFDELHEYAEDVIAGGEA